MNLKYNIVKPLILVTIMLLSTAFSAEDAVRYTFFKDADSALAKADKVSAKVLAPKNYSDAMEAYNDAERGLERGRNLDQVRKNVVKAETYFLNSVKSAKLAKTVLGQVIKSRQDASSANAAKLSSDNWYKAESKFSSAINYLERGNLKRAKELDVEATNLYRDAELAAIKAEYLSETRKLISDAERAKVDRYAPLTVNKAKQLLAEAEKELNENRYDADRPRSLAKQANYEAKHAFYLNKIVRAVKDKNLSVEELVLNWEKPLNEIASAADISASMSNGFEQVQIELIDYIDSLRTENQSLQQEKESGLERISTMEKELAKLDEKLGGATAERQALAKRLLAQAKIKAQFEKVDKMFAKHEARVFREGNDIIIRLVGLSFDSGKSDLQGNAFGLLSKVKQAQDLFPSSELSIEGHTDSYGGDELNLALSEDRAIAVQLYMINSLGVPTKRITAVGYGETNPVANNETAIGRAKNRRIDVVIKPNLNQ